MTCLNPWPLVASCIMICSQRLSSGNQLFSQDVRRTRTTNVASHVLGGGKGNGQTGRTTCRTRRGGGKSAADVGYAFAQGRRVVDGGHLLWLGPALSCFLLCRASELWAYAGRSDPPPKFCLTQNSLTFLHEGVYIAFENRSAASASQVHLLASRVGKRDQGAPLRKFGS